MQKTYKPNKKEKTEAKKASKILKAYLSKFGFELWAVSKDVEVHKL